MSKRSVTLVSMGVFAVSVAGCGVEPQPGQVESSQDELYVKTSTLWPIVSPWSSATAPVCWEDAGFDTEKAWVRDAITQTWELESQLRFLGFGTCTGPNNAIRVHFQDALGSTSGLGTEIRGVSNGMKLNTWQSSSCVSGWTRERCVKSTAVHEMAHGLGFAHEQNRPDTPASCTQAPQGENGNLTIGDWDIKSTTNYCNPTRNGDARLSGTDIDGMQEMYGNPTPITASTWGANTMAAFIRGPGNALYENFTNDGVNWGSFFTQDGFLTSAPSVVSWGSDRLDVFARGSDGAVWQKFWTFSGGWSGWNSLGGSTRGKPKAIARAVNRLDIFARGDFDDALWTRSWNGTSWSAWTSLGQDYVGEPTITSWGSNRLDVLVRARDNTLQHKSWNGTSWSGWTNLGGGDLISSPSAASWGTNRVDVVVARSDFALWHRAWTGSSWSAWESLGGSILGTPRVTARAANILDIFTRSSDNALWQKSWTGSAWTSWTSLGGVIKGSPEVQTPNSGKVEVFAQGTDDAVWRRTWTGSWTGWIQVGGTIK